MTQNGNGASPKDTALRVAMLRAAHQLLDHPLVFEDPLALAVLGPEGEAELRRDLEQRPERHAHPLSRGLRANLAARSRLAERAWAGAKARGVGQCVVLGAGLDTLALRDRDPERRFFEVDFPATQAWKRGLLRAAGIAEPAGLAFAAVDFETTDLEHGLARAGFDAAAPAFVTWLGVTMYLEPADVYRTLGLAAALPPGSEVFLDYAVAPELLEPREREVQAFLAERTARGGEPWKGFFRPDELARRLAGLGFGAVEDLDAERINAELFAGRGDGLKKTGSTRLVSARVGSPVRP